MIDTRYVLPYIQKLKKGVKVTEVEIVNLERNYHEPVLGTNSVYTISTKLEPIVEVTIQIPYENLKSFQEIEGEEDV